MQTRIDPHTLNVLQQALRALTLSVATAAKADLHVVAKMLQASAANDQLAPDARLMLMDLAKGMAELAATLQPRPARRDN